MLSSRKNIASKPHLFVKKVWLHLKSIAYTHCLPAAFLNQKSSIFSLCLCTHSAGRRHFGPRHSPWTPRAPISGMTAPVRTSRRRRPPAAGARRPARPGCCPRTGRRRRSWDRRRSRGRRPQTL